LCAAGKGAENDGIGEKGVKSNSDETNRGVVNEIKFATSRNTRGVRRFWGRKNGPATQSVGGGYYSYTKYNRSRRVRFSE